MECKAFSELTILELYDLLRLRQEVFIVEQNCPYMDCDDKDQLSWHVLAYKNNTLIGYARLLRKGISYDDYSSIGRVITHEDYRKMGVGQELMRYSIKKLQALDPGHDIKLSSQVYIMNFYAEFGFEAVGESYLEDDIPHHAMVLYAKSE